MRIRATYIIVAAITLLLGSWRHALAHSMFQSAVLLDYHARSVDAELQLPPSRLEKALGRTIGTESLGDVREQLETYVLHRIIVRTPSQSEWKVQLSRPISWETIDGAPYVVAHLILLPPFGASVRGLTLEDDVITDSLPNHVVLVSVRSDWNSSTFANDPELIGVLNGEDRSIEINRGSSDWARGFTSIFHLGVRHIAEGTDHLLFLLALLLPAPLFYRTGRWNGFAGVRHGFTQILKVVTSFTIGHSITLALAASGVVHVPGRPIEVLIAVSILISAVHAARPLFPGREPYIAGGFGLIHGLAFASTLAELGLHRWERVAGIFAFNVGIEAMQLVVVVCIMPSLMLLSNTPLYAPFRVAGAILAGLSACGWILERILDRTFHVDVIVDCVANHAILFVLSLFLISLVANLLLRQRRIHSCAT